MGDDIIPGELILISPAKLKAWRKGLGKIQQEVADRAGVTQKQISLFEHRLGGEIGTYLKVNQALYEIEREQQSA